MPLLTLEKASLAFGRKFQGPHFQFNRDLLGEQRLAPGFFFRIVEQLAPD